jgi:hypothetical protein
MTVLSLEDSKALYDAGIKIETKHIYDNGSLKKLLVGSKQDSDIPAPDLEELLEYTKRIAKKYDKSLLAIAWSEHNTGKDKWWADLEGCRVADGTFADSPIKALANLLLKLKEEGYEV